MKKINSFSTYVLYLVTLSLLIPNYSSHAVVLDKLLPRHWAKKAEFVFLGEVIDITYKSSESVSNEQRPIPHTFVSFKVEEVLKGKSNSNETFTIRLEGGLSDDGRILVLSGSPLFDLGDRGIFFIHGNGRNVCPLVGWKQSWVRIQDEEIFTDTGVELLLSDDPVLAARIHPRDILDFDKLSERIVSGDRKIDQIIRNAISKESQLLIEDPNTISQLDGSVFNYRFTDDLIQNLRSKNIGSIRPFLKKYMPTAFRQLPYNPRDAILYRDLNWILLKFSLFSMEDLENIELSSELRELLQTDEDQLSMGQILLKNRRILEHAYPDLITKSMDESVIEGQYEARQSIMINKIGSVEFNRMQMVELEPGEGPSPEPNPLPKGEKLTLSTFLPHLKSLIDTIHTPEELENLEPAISADINQTILVNLPKPTTIPFNLDAVPNAPQTPDEEEELRLLEESGGNPVLKKDQ